MSLGKYVEVFIFKAALIPHEFTLSLKPSLLYGFPLIKKFIASMFLHGGFVHIAGNMLFLWIFGNNVEDTLGHMRFLLFYLLCGIMASSVHIFMNPASTVPIIGASGAIAGVLGAYFLLFPRARVWVLFFFIIFVRLIPVPAVIVLGMWFILQILSAPAGGDVAWYAHIGGFIAGMTLIMVFQKRKRKYRRFL